MITAKPPLHPFEVRISIGDCTWEHAVASMEYLLQQMKEYGPKKHNIGGGFGGSYEMTTTVTEITPTQYHTQLEEWSEAVLAARRSS